MIRLGRDPSYREAIAQARSVIPDPILDRVAEVGFLCGVDPVFAGLHRWTEATFDGIGTVRYAETAHYDPASATVVLPTYVSPAVVVHELGHALDFLTEPGLDPAPVTSYAATNRREAFAEAFLGWVLPEAVPWVDEYLDPRTRAFLEEVAR
jgi:hypothetical protein